MPAAPVRPHNTDPCETMSNATQNSRNSGDSRRRRSRGGQNRRNNNDNSERQSTEGRQPNGRQSGGGKREGGRTGGRQDSGKPQRRPMPAPIQLSWWQKLLKAVGLYKEPVRPPRPERRPDAVEAQKTREPRRTKTRDARTDSSPSGEEAGTPARGKRRERGDREGGRQRGGDPSTVENRRVYVGNLSYDVTESDLEELFKGVGAVRRIEIVYNRNTHRSKGYGFVEMLDIDEAKRTVEVLHDQFFMGRKLTVSGAKSQEHEAAEKEESAGEPKSQAMPALAPLPPKEEVLDLIAEPKPEEPVAEAIAEEPHAEIPTEEFHETAETVESEEETEQRANA